MCKRGISKITLPTLAGIIFVFIWQLLDNMLNISTILLPSPLEIVTAFIAHFPLLLHHSIITTTEAVVGFLLGSTAGLFTAVVFVSIPWTQKTFYPYAIALKAAPIYVFAPLLVIWFGNGIMPKAIMAGIIAFFPILVNSVKGLMAIDQDTLDVFRSLNASRFDILKKLRLPSSLPFVFSALKIATTYSIVGAIIAEFTGASEGIGFLIISSSYYLEMSSMFAGIIMISFIGVLFFFCIEFLERRIIFWHFNNQ